MVAGLAAELGLDPPAALAALAAADLFGQAEAVKAAGRAFGGLLDPTHPQETTP